MGKNEMKMRENNERNRRKGVNIQKKSKTKMKVIEEDENKKLREHKWKICRNKRRVRKEDIKQQKELQKFVSWIIIEVWILNLIRSENKSRTIIKHYIWRRTLLQMTNVCYIFICCKASFNTVSLIHSQALSEHFNFIFFYFLSLKRE